MAYIQAYALMGLKPSSICRRGPPWKNITAGWGLEEPASRGRNNCAWDGWPSLAVKVIASGMTNFAGGKTPDASGPNYRHFPSEANTTGSKGLVESLCRAKMLASPLICG